MAKSYKNSLAISTESFFLALAVIIDTIMVSRLGPSAVAAVGLTNQPKFIGLTAFFSINVAISAIVARRKGQGKRKEAHETLLTGFILSVILCIIITSIFLFKSDKILELAGSNPDTHVKSKEYLDIIMGFSIFSVISMCINAAQRGCGNTKIAFYTNLISSLVNVVFNYLLIEGNLGAPRLEIKGAAIATILGTVVASIISFSSLFSKKSYLSAHFIIEKKIKAKARSLITITKIGLNMFVENIFMRVGFLATALLAAGLGTDEFAAYNVGLNYLSLGFAFADGMQVASVALTGESLGEGNKEKALLYSSICQRIGLIISIVLSTFLFIFGKDLFKLYFKEEHIIEYGVIICRFIMIIVLLQISQIIYGGTLRAAGDIKYTLFSTILAVTFIRTIVTYILVKIMGLGIVGIWLGILSDQFSRFVFLSLRYRSKKWLDMKI